MKSVEHVIAVFAIAAMTFSLAVTPAAAQDRRVEVGSLNCDIERGFGLIIASKKAMTCVFTRSDRAPSEVYVGEIGRFGLDIGGTRNQKMVWGVFAPSRGPIEKGRLAGRYVGASAEATAIVGLGANALVGGFDNSFALQPLSLQTQQGLNLALGVSRLVLRSAE